MPADIAQSGRKWADLGNGDRAEIIAARPHRGAASAITLLASAARTASGTGTDVTDTDLENVAALLLVLDVTAQSGGTPTLDVAIQAKIGSLYYPLARAAQIAAATTKNALKVCRYEPLATAMVLEADPAVGTGLLVVNGVWLDSLRVKWDIAGTTPSYTFSVVAYPLR